jgi:TonB family protein
VIAHAVIMALLFATVPAASPSTQPETKSTEPVAASPGEVETLAEVIPPRLIGELPRVTGVPARRGAAHLVVLEITITMDGVPQDITIKDGAGEPWDSAVLSAARELRFEPATRGGEPLAVRVQLPYSVGDPIAWQARKRRPIEGEARLQGIALNGQIVEMGTRKRLAGLTVILEGTKYSTITDADGNFVFKDLPRRKYTLVVPGYDHEETKRIVRIPTQNIRIRLKRKSNMRYRTVIKGRTGDASRILIPMEQAREVAGSSGDPLKVIESLPGIARPAAAGPGAGQISVRGSAPEDTKFYIDGMPLFQLYHFGNLYSVIQDEWIRNIDFRPGGFSTEYGNATGGLLAVTLADIENDGIHGHIDINIYHTAALLSFPVGEDWSMGFALRRSYIDAVLGAVIPEDAGFGLSVAPRYYDYQFRADYRPNDRFSLRLLSFGSDDLFSFVLDNPPDSDPSFTGFEFGRSFHQLQATMNYVIAPGLDLFAGLMSGYQLLNIVPGEAGFSLAFCPLTLRSHISWRGIPKLELRGGVLATLQRYAVDLNIPAPTKEGQIQLPLSSQEWIQAQEEGYTGETGLWMEAKWLPIPELSIVGGLRFSAWIGNFEEVALDPRLTIAWDILEDTRLTVSGGLNNQAPFPDETSKSVGSPHLTVESSAYSGIGIRQKIGDYLSIEGQGFYKHLYNLVSPTDEPYGGIPYDNNGSGYAVGGELLARWNTEWFDGWVSYTLSRSRRTDQPGQEDRFFSYDQTHVLALVAGLKLPLGWRIGARFRLTSGNPFTPLEAGYYDATSDVYVPKPAGSPLSNRVPDFIALDLRVDKLWLFDDWRLKVYLEFQNATNQENVEFVNYNEDYSKRDDVNGLPIIPSFGMRASF